MKRTAALIVIATMLASCGTIEKLSERRKERRSEQAKGKSKTSSTSVSDSTAKQRETYNQFTERVSEVDTTIVVYGDTLNASGKLPADGVISVFTDGNITTHVSVDNGMLNVKTITRSKSVPVRKKTTERQYRSGDVTTEVSERSKVVAKTESKAKSDAKTSGKVVASSKHVERDIKPFVWAMAGVLAFGLLLLWVFRKVNIFT